MGPGLSKARVNAFVPYVPRTSMRWRVPDLGREYVYVIDRMYTLRPRKKPYVLIAYNAAEVGEMKVLWRGNFAACLRRVPMPRVCMPRRDSDDAEFVQAWV